MTITCSISQASSGDGTIRRDGGRRLVYSAGYAAALMLARADRAALMSTFARNYAVLNAEVEALRREVAELRERLGLRPPGAPVH